MDMRSAEFAHDLKVPLQLIACCVQLLEGEVQADSPAGDYLRTLARSTDQLQSMVRSALEKEDIRSGLRDVVADGREIAREFAVLGGRKGVHVDFTGNASKFCIRTDGEKLRRILHNLMSNALRFTPHGGRIVLRVQVLGDAVEFSVSDTGCGIPTASLQRIFEPGFTTGGSGHGLAIAKKYAGLLGGSLKVDSLPGMGSCFTLRLPV